MLSAATTNISSAQILSSKHSGFGPDTNDGARIPGNLLWGPTYLTIGRQLGGCRRVPSGQRQLGKTPTKPTGQRLTIGIQFGGVPVVPPGRRQTIGLQSGGVPLVPSGQRQSG